MYAYIPLVHLINDVITKEKYESFTQGISLQIQSLKEKLFEYEKSLSASVGITI